MAALGVGTLRHPFRYYSEHKNLTLCKLPHIWYQIQVCNHISKFALTQHFSKTFYIWWRPFWTNISKYGDHKLLIYFLKYISIKMQWKYIEYNIGLVLFINITTPFSAILRKSNMAATKGRHPWAPLLKLISI